MVENGTFAWGHGEEDGKPMLKDINLTVPDGFLVAVVGSVGAGKSSLCSAILGEMEKQSGRVNVKVILVALFKIRVYICGILSPKLTASWLMQNHHQYPLLLHISAKSSIMAVFLFHTQTTCCCASTSSMVSLSILPGSPLFLWPHLPSLCQ